MSTLSLLPMIMLSVHSAIQSRPQYFEYGSSLAGEAMAYSIVVKIYPNRPTLSLFDRPNRNTSALAQRDPK